jgi:hypothetical protein
MRWRVDWSKKGALELSINAIVVLILAITILGLGIAFIRGQFGALQKQFTEVGGEVKTQMTQKIRESGELLAFNQQEIEVTAGKTETFYYGVQNEHIDQSVCAAVLVRCIKGLTNTQGGCTGSDALIVGGEKVDQKWFSLFTPVIIKAGDVGVYQMEIQVSNAPKDSYLMELSVIKPTGANGGSLTDCSAATGVYDKTTGEIDATSGDWAILTKQFFLKVS